MKLTWVLPTSERSCRGGFPVAAMQSHKGWAQRREGPARQHKAQGIRLHHAQRSSLGGKCRSRLCPGGSQCITKYIKHSLMSPLLSFTGHLCHTMLRTVLLLPQGLVHTLYQACCCPENLALLLFQNPEWVQTESQPPWPARTALSPHTHLLVRGQK